MLCKTLAGLAACKTLASWESRTEAVEREACRLDRSEGSIYDVLRPVYLRTKVRINPAYSPLCVRGLLEFRRFSGLSVRRGYSAVCSTDRERETRVH